MHARLTTGCISAPELASAFDRGAAPNGALARVDASTWRAPRELFHAEPRSVLHRAMVRPTHS